MREAELNLTQLLSYGLSEEEERLLTRQYPAISFQRLRNNPVLPFRPSPLVLGAKCSDQDIEGWVRSFHLIYLFSQENTERLWKLQQMGVRHFLPLNNLPRETELLALLQSSAPGQPKQPCEESLSLVWTLDPELNLKYWPQETAALFKMPTAELVGQNFLDLPIHPQQSPDSLAQWQRLKEDRQNQRFDYRFHHPDGYRLSLSLQLYYQSASETEEVQWLVIGQHQSDVKASALPELRFRKLIEHSHDVVIIAEPDSRMRYLSPSVNRILGYSIAQVEGLLALDFLHPEDRPEVETRLIGLLKEREEIPELRLRIRHHQGHYLWALVHINDRRLVPGVEGIVINFREVDELFHTREELKNSLERFKWASLATQDVIWEYRIDSDQLVWGENLEHIFGPFPGPINRLEDFIRRVEARKQETLRRSFKDFPPPPENYWQLEYRFQDGEGNWRYIKDQGYLVRNDKGEVYKVIGAMRDYTTEFAYQEEIRRRENRFRGLFEKALIGISQINAKGQFLSCNAALENILGHRGPDIIGQALADLLHPDDHNRFNQALQDLEQSSNLSPSPLRLRRGDGLYAECIATAFLEKEETESVSWWYLLDISQMQKTTNALEKAQRRLNELVQSASDVLVVLNQDSKYEFVAANIQKLLGYLPEEMLGRDNLDFMHPEDIPLVQAAFEEAVANFGSDTRSRFRALHKQGHWVWVEVNGKMQVNSEGKPEALLHVRKLEDSQKYHSELLKKARVAEVSQQSIIITDTEERIEWANASFTKLSGYSLAEARGKTISELLHGPESLANYHKFTKAKLQAGEAFTVENINYHKEGYLYWIESSVSPVRSPEGELIGFVALEKDISERRKNFLALEQQLEELNADHSKLRNYSYTLSHNFRSHISNISAISHELKNQKLQKAERSMLEDMLYQSTQQLQSSLLELNRELEKPSDGGAMDQTLQPLDFVEKVLDQMQSAIQDLGVKVEIDLAPQSLVLGRPAYLESIFHNLLSNALRYRHPERPLQVKIFSQVEKRGELKVSVCDNGLGIDLAKYGEALFQFRRSFHQHPESQGIGLYIVREQLRMMQARVEVESEPNQGCCFHLYFRSPPAE